KNCVKLRFIDSYMFLSASLDKLASYLDKDKLKIVRSEFSTLSDEEFKLLTRRICTRVRFELLTYIDMVMFIERGICGGLSQCSGRYVQANNKCMHSYDSSKPSSYFMYYDVNNLYGWAMCQPLPYAEFRWVENATNFDVSAIAQDSPTGYILDVDLEYPQHLHDRHTDLPFCPTRDKPPGKREDKLFDMCYNSLNLHFHHEYMSPLYHKCKIMYTDTDSFIYRIECDDVYETMKRDIARFDTSDYPADNVYGMPLANKKVLGLMKDENNGVLMTEFVGHRAKMYAMRVNGKKDIKKAKVVKSNVVTRMITFDDYTRCLNKEIEMTRSQSCIRSKLHEVYTTSESKIALTSYYDKRYVVPDSTETLPWGHWRKSS
ncbi:hypothetical protein ALC57_08900, partial [Trachymyrmex cornetzi]